MSKEDFIFNIGYEPIEGEIWKEWEKSPLYQISNKGRVRSINGRFRHNNCKEWRLLKPCPSNRKVPYLRYGFCIGGKTRMYYASRLVYEAFIGKIPDRHKVIYKDGDYTNNSVENLTLMSYKDFFWNEKTKKIGRNGCFSRETFIGIAREHFCDKVSLSDLAVKYNVPYYYIVNACQRHKNKVI